MHLCTILTHSQLLDIYLYGHLTAKYHSFLRSLPKDINTIENNKIFNISHYSCNERDQNANGCKAVDETPLEVDLVTQLDPARDLQRLHSLIIGMYMKNYFLKSDIKLLINYCLSNRQYECYDEVFRYKYAKK